MMVVFTEGMGSAPLGTHRDQAAEAEPPSLGKRSRRARVGRALLSWTFAVLLAAGLGEVAAYVGLQTLGLPTYMERPPRSEFEPWGTWGKPNTTSHLAFECFNVSYRFNDIGARDRDRSPSGSGRWIMLGDSFVEGYGVEEDARLSNLLEQSSGHEILNFGMSGNFGPLQYLILYRELARKYEHDGIIVGFLPDNDFRDNDQVRWASKSRESHWLRHRPYYTLSEDRKSLSVQFGVFGNSVPSQNLDKQPRLPSSSIAGKISNGFSDFLQLASEKAGHASSLFALYRMVKWRLTTSVKNEDGEAGRSSSYFTTDEKDIAAARIIFHDLAEAAAGKRKLMLVFPRNWDIEEQRRKNAQGSPEFLAMLDDFTREGWDVKDLSQVPGIKNLSNLSLDCDEHWNPAAHKAAADFLIDVVK